MLGKAVRRGLKTPLMVGDMPMGSYEASNELAVQNAQRLVKETGCQAVKLEARRHLGRARPGDRPRRHPGDGPRRPDPADRHRARRLQGPGQDRRGRDQAAARTPWRCSRSAASRSSSRRSRRRSPRRSSTKLEVPTIGIGAGPATAGQVLVFHDLLGITTGHMAKFVKRYADVHEAMVDGGARATPTRSARGHFPEPEHVYASSRPSSPSSGATSTRRAWRRRRPGTGSRCPERPEGVPIRPSNHGRFQGLIRS